MPIARPSLSARSRTISVIFWRSPEITSFTVRDPNSERSAELMVCESRFTAAASLPCTAMKYWRTSTMRHFTNESTSTFFFSEVW